MVLTLAEAAQATGVSRSTILRHIKSGRISGTRGNKGAWLVEADEVFQVLPAQGQPKAIQQDGQGRTTLEAEIANLKWVAKLLRRQLDDLTRDRQRWAAQVSKALLTSSGAALRVWRRLAG